MGKCPKCSHAPCHCYPMDSPWWDALARINGYEGVTLEMTSGIILALAAETEARRG